MVRRSLFALLAAALRHLYRHTTQAMRLLLTLAAMVVPLAVAYPLAAFTADDATREVIERDRSPGRLGAALARVRQGIQVLRVLLLVEHGQAGPALGVPRLPCERPLEGGAKAPMLFWNELLAVSEEADDQFVDRQRVGVPILQRGAERSGQHTVRITDRRHDSSRQVVL